MAHPRRPDPAQGVFETLLVLDGRPVELDAHLARLEASLAALFPTSAAPDPREAIEARAREIGFGSIRTGIAPRGQRRNTDLGAEVESRSAYGSLCTISVHKEPYTRISLQSLPLPGGLGAHKWADRSLLDAAQAQLPDDSLPLIVDADGAALEASRANVFAVREGALFTPPLDGRILPGITRMRVLELAGEVEIETAETVLSVADLLGADEVFLTGSVRGIEPVSSLDGVALGGDPAPRDLPVTAQLTEDLRRAWLGAARSPSPVAGRRPRGRRSPRPVG